MNSELFNVILVHCHHLRTYAYYQGSNAFTTRYTLPRWPISLYIASPLCQGEGPMSLVLTHRDLSNPVANVPVCEPVALELHWDSDRTGQEDHLVGGRGTARNTPITACRVASTFMHSI